MGKEQTDFVTAMAEQCCQTKPWSTDWSDKVDEEEQGQVFGNLQSEVHVPRKESHGRDTRPHDELHQSNSDVIIEGEFSMDIGELEVPGTDLKSLPPEDPWDDKMEMDSVCGMSHTCPFLGLMIIHPWIPT